MVKKKNSMVGAVAVPVKRRGLWKTIWRYKWLYLMLVPVIAYYAIFKYAPMYGIVIAFQNYNVFKGVFGSEFIGLDVFKKIFAKTNFWTAIRNTIFLNFATMVINFPLTIIIALMLNELRNLRFKKLTQSVLYLPHFICKRSIVDA